MRIDEGINSQQRDPPRPQLTRRCSRHGIRAGPHLSVMSHSVKGATLTKALYFFDTACGTFRSLGISTVDPSKGSFDLDFSCRVLASFTDIICGKSIGACHDDDVRSVLLAREDSSQRRTFISAVMLRYAEVSIVPFGTVGSEHMRRGFFRKESTISTRGSFLV